MNLSVILLTDRVKFYILHETIKMEINCKKILGKLFIIHNAVLDL